MILFVQSAFLEYLMNTVIHDPVRDGKGAKVCRQRKGRRGQSLRVIPQDLVGGAAEGLKG